MVVVRLINAVIISSIYLLISPLLLARLLFWREEKHEYPREKKEATEPPFPLESAARVELFRKCVGKSVATLPFRRMPKKVRSGELVSPITPTEDSVFSGKLWQVERHQRVDASLRRVRSKRVRDGKAERASSIS